MKRLPLLLLMFILAACGSVATPAATPTDAFSAQLTETYTGSDMLNGSLTVHYPAGWGAKADESGLEVQLASDPALLNSAQKTVPAGQIHMIITMSPLSVVTAATPEDETLTPQKFLNAFVEQDKAAGSTLPYGEVTAISIAGKSAARVTAQNAEGAVLIVVMALPDGYALISGTTPPNELTASEPLILAIIGSVDYVLGAE